MTVKHKYRTDSAAWVTYCGQLQADFSDPGDDMTWIDCPECDKEDKKHDIQSTVEIGKLCNATKQIIAAKNEDNADENTEI